MSSTHETDGDQVKTVDTKGSGDEKPAVSNIDYSHSRDARHTSSSDGSVSDNEDKEATIGKHEPAEVDHEAEQKLEEAHLSAAEIEEHNFSPEEYKSTLRRIDMVMMPFMCLAVLLQFIDKTRCVLAGRGHARCIAADPRSLCAPTVSITRTC